MRNKQTVGQGGAMYSMDDWQTRVDSIDVGGMRLYHAYAFNEKTKQVIEGDSEGLDEEQVRQDFQRQLAFTLMQLQMEEQMRAAQAQAQAQASEGQAPASPAE